MVIERKALVVVLIIQLRRSESVANGSSLVIGGEAKRSRLWPSSGTENVCTIEIP